MLLLFAKSVAGVVEILIMIALGYVLTQMGWFNESASKLIARLVTQIALPAYMAYTIVDKFSFHSLVSTLPDLRFPVISMMILFVISIIVAHFFYILRRAIWVFLSPCFLTQIRCLSVSQLTSLYLVRPKAYLTCWFTIWQIPPSFGHWACT